jgi:GT2 family glycosyltransferase
MSNARQISVVIPTYNRRESVALILRALATQTLPADQYEVIVLIDGSRDGTQELVSGFRAPYRLRCLWQTNSGRATACNSGAREAIGEILLFLDDDMEPDPDCLRAHLAAHEGSASRAVMGAIPLSLKRPCAPLLDFLQAKVGPFLERLAEPGYKMTVRDFFSSNLSIRRDLFLQIGGFDESFRIYGNEDVELAFRLFRAGISVLFHPEIIAHQHYLKEFAGLARDNIDKGHTAVLLATKHPEVVGSLKLSQYREYSRKWRCVRAVLLFVSGVWSRAPEWTIRCVEWAERFRRRDLNRLYFFALDYFFWLGVRRELKENHEAAKVAPALVSRIGGAK